MRPTYLVATLGLVASICAGAWVLARGWGSAAPDLTVTTTVGKQIALKHLQGHPVLINFWSVGCRPCIDEMPWLSQLYRRLAPKGLEMIAVAMPDDRPDNVLEIARREGLTYPIALDLTGEIARAFGGVSATPTTLLLGPGGHIRLRRLGPIDNTDLEQQIEEMF